VAQSRGPVGVEIAVPAPLRFLLPGRDRHRGRRLLRYDADATVGHLVQAAGVPLTEVGVLRLDGEPVAETARTRPGSTIEVTEAVRPVAPPPGGFLLDVGLGTLARRLRLLGLDAAWSNDADDADLVARAGAEDRVLLTQDRGLLMRRALDRAGQGHGGRAGQEHDGRAGQEHRGRVRRRNGALVRGSRPDDQLADVLDRFAPVLAPLTRCTACNGVLRPAPQAEVAGLLEPGTRRTVEEFARCVACRRIYWHGAHGRRIEALVRAAVER
jgi:uncharacterized protein with PIN domain